ncbi:MAG: 4-hydroxy-3-methylbut-2-enyl diphosphate reductase [Planctomycetia bacterium]|nr:4-hydroxy-3-methylbut-2-enyl diphosphate reductase [Planctomycetia bacterium]
MRVILANPRGFCAGVNMAIEALDQSIKQFGTPLYVYHEIVHNRYVVDRFKTQGVTFVNEIAEVPNGGTVLYSAHGVSPALRQEAKARQLRAIDATCPLVTKVHMEAIKFAKDGYHILLIGHADHDEVIGTMGEAPTVMTLVETVEDVEKLPFTTESKLAYLTQTTLSVDDANMIISALKKRFPQLIGPNKEDICYATQNRQEAVKELAKEVDLVLVLGSQNSSNSQRLAELAKLMGKQAHLIDTVAELDPAWLLNVKSVLVTAGASAPEVVVQDLIDYLIRCYGAKVETHTVREEHVRFPLPKELRLVMA